MYMRYYDGYPSPENYGERTDGNTDVSVPDTPESEETVCEKSETAASPGEITTAGAPLSGIFSSLKLDDIMLIVLLFVLLEESADDIIMPIIIGYILLEGLGNNGSECCECA